ncbi:sensor histidine kinase KdpD [Porphyromonas sp. COT-290 OH860]|uniref:sensor histidine kinase n=1 Tax=Porphyromonas sp. COT-290 OH860 TaxID=1515615 RepID=UPI00052B8D03|nr:HAMP domain-containing sensor histidine kinase [Porphyromonas sp. COT-290 OH860]KGN85538.1 histidine kinase [Porphyromonas sp. COT-290 OH860]
MKLIHHTISRLSVALSIVLALWAVFFYFAMINEVTDEIDDSLEDYAELLIVHALSGEQLPSEHTNSNNQYYLSPISTEEAYRKPHITYADSMVYIPLKRETEPARIMTIIYKDGAEQYYELAVFTPTIEKQDLMGAILFWVVFLYLSLLVVVMVVTTIIYERNNKPLYRLLKWLDQYQVGQSNVPLDTDTDIVEFQKLNDAALRQVKRSEEVFEEQKQFIGNASHEIQTPVAVSMNRIETLMQDETLTEEQLSELAKTHQTLEYLSKLNKSLLLLFRIDNHQFVERQPIELNALLYRSLEDYKEVYDHLHISVSVQDRGTLNLVINDVLASILINNLLKNSFVHNVPHGAIHIEITPQSLTIRNSSESEALDPQVVFERFYQGYKKKGSIGLGLALVKSVCDMEQLSIRYYWQDNLHCFEIQKAKKE